MWMRTRGKCVVDRTIQSLPMQYSVPTVKWFEPDGVQGNICRGRRPPHLNFVTKFSSKLPSSLWDWASGAHQTPWFGRSKCLNEKVPAAGSSHTVDKLK